MANLIRTGGREMVDIICRRTYGDESGFVEQVFSVNPGLAAKGTPLPTGTEMLLPDLPRAAETVKVVKLWE